MIDALLRVKSNLDSGIPQAIQRMAIAALEGPQDCIAEHNAVYQRRRDRLVAALRSMGLRVRPPKASLYLWARVPEGLTSVSFAERLLDETGVVVTPGVGLRPLGRGLRAPLAHRAGRPPGGGPPPPPPLGSTDTAARRLKPPHLILAVARSTRRCTDDNT